MTWTGLAHPQGRAATTISIASNGSMRAAAMGGDEPIAVTVEPEDLDRLHDGIDEPYVRDGVASEDRHLLGAVDRLGQVEDLANPVGRDGRVRLREVRHSFATPPARSGTTTSTMQWSFRLVEDDPAPWPAAPALERWSELAAGARGDRMATPAGDARGGCRRGSRRRRSPGALRCLRRSRNARASTWPV